MKSHDIDLLIGANLKRIRLQKGLSQEELGTLINNAKTKISALENGKEGLGKELMAKICQSLKIRPSEFYIEPGTPIITNDKEKEILRKFREAENLQADEEVNSMTQWIIDNASKKNQSNIDNIPRKPKKVSKKAM